jgi:hypothetical protein
MDVRVAGAGAIVRSAVLETGAIVLKPRCTRRGL